jgi:hypothetical protein
MNPNDNKSDTDKMRDALVDMLHDAVTASKDDPQLAQCRKSLREHFIKDIDGFIKDFILFEKRY